MDDTEPLSPETEARVRASFAAQAMMQTLGATMEALGPGTCRIVAPILPLARQQHGYGHAALPFAIGDSAGGYAALTLMEPDREVVTAEIKINLLAPTTGDRLVAEGRVIRAGRRLMTVQSDVFAETPGARRRIAVLLGTMVPVTPRSGPGRPRD